MSSPHQAVPLTPDELWGLQAHVDGCPKQHYWRKRLLATIAKQAETIRELKALHQRGQMQEDTMKCAPLGDAGFVCTGDLVQQWTCRCVRNAIAASIRDGHYDGKTPGELADEILAFGGHDPNITHPVAGCPCSRCCRDLAKERMF